MTGPTTPRGPEDSGDEAEEALDHALRERAVDPSEFDYDDDPDTSVVLDDTGADAAESSGTDGESADDAEDYVLYSEVKPHLEALVALQAERDKMIDLLLYARDRVSSAAVAGRMDDNLAQLGIQVLAPEVGSKFDPTQHEASATVPAADKTVHGTIAELELAGYIDGERVVRHPVVTVYSTDVAEQP